MTFKLFSRKPKKKVRMITVRERTRSGQYAGKVKVSDPNKVERSFFATWR